MTATYRSLLLKGCAASLLLIASSLTSHAQGPVEAYRFSMRGLHGTARAQALGGAVGAIGADPTAIYVNPAGIGLYNRSALSITADPGNMTTQGVWKGFANSATTSTENRHGIGSLSNISYATPLSVDYETGFKLNFGVSYNRDFDYGHTYRLAMGPTPSGLADYISNLAMSHGKPFKDYWEEVNYNPFNYPVHPLITMAINGLLIESVPTNGEHYSLAKAFRPAFNEPDPQSPGNRLILLPESTTLNVSEAGDKNSFDFTLGTGLNDVFYFGASLRLGTLSYSRSTKHTEEFYYRDNTSGIENKSHFSLHNNITTTGASISANIGAIAMLGDYVRLGLSYQTSEYMSLNDSYNSAIYVYNDVNLPEDKNSSYETITFESTAYLSTPGMLTASAMVLLSDYGFLSYDYQYRNLGKSVLTDSNKNSMIETNYIQEDYGVEHTHRFGVEFRPISRLSARAGYSFTGNPLNKGAFRDEPAEGLLANAGTVGTQPDFVLPRTYTTLSAGIGYRLSRRLNLDLAFVQSTRLGKAYAYSGQANDGGITNDPNVVVKGVDLKSMRHNIVATATFTF